MLKRLDITSFAIIDHVIVDFTGGFTVLTGPTGAGKSLIIDSLALLLGGRASTEMIRAGADKAIIKGEFSIPNISFYLDSIHLDIPRLETLTIERTISKKGSSVKINGVSATVNDLELLGPSLADIHTQLDFVKILYPENYLSILDSYGDKIIDPLLAAYEQAYHDYLSAVREHEALLKQKRDFEANKEFHTYQYQELKAMNLSSGEKEANENEIALLSNYDKVYALSAKIKELSDGDALNPLYEIEDALKELAKYQPDLAPYSEAIAEANISFASSLDAFNRKCKDVEYDPNRLDELQQRQFDLNALERKYHKSVDELIAMQEELAMLINDATSFDFSIKEAEAKCKQTEETALAKGKELSLARKEVAKRIEKEIERDLAALLLKSRFEISFTPTALGTNGIDAIDFLIETNVGEGLKPLSKTVSGGEASRIMLAFKALLLRAKKTPTVILDEIDTGVSGEVAMAVASTIKNISSYAQVIAITHLPQVASSSDSSLLIQKSVREGRTFVNVKPLSLEEKIDQVAQLISGGKITAAQRDYAKEMIFGKK